MQSNDMEKPERRQALAYFLAIFLCLTLALTLVWSGISFIQQTIDASAQRVHALQTSEWIKSQIENEIRTYVRELSVAANINSLKNFLMSGAQADKAEVSSYYRLVMEANPAIAQIRYLNPQGQEVIRLDRHDGHIVYIKGTDLQNKSNRYYFTETQKLRSGDIYISPMDLNMEKGVIEIPWKPVLRLATPVQTSTSTSTKALPGVFIINFDASALLGFVSRYSQVYPEIFLVNNEGYYLVGKPKELLWGFMLGDSHTLANDEPELWQLITNQEQDGLLRNAPIEAVSRIDLNWYFQNQLQMDGWVSASNLWYLVLRSPIRPLFVISPLNLGILATLLLMIGLIAWFWSQSIIRHRQVERQIQQAEEKLIHSERMASLGELVAGVSHELNTPIGNAITIASTLGDMADSMNAEINSGQLRKSSILNLLEELKSGSHFLLSSLNRASALIGTFKEIAVDQSSEQRRSFQLDNYLHEIADTMASHFKHTPVKLIVEADTGITLNSFPGPLGQVIMNLINNALIHAFPEPRESQYVKLIAQRLADGNVMIAVGDNGVGMDNSTLSKVFNPFFTTKMGQGGSGLGLSIAHNIVTNVLGGNISAVSIPDQITRFKIIIPISAPASAIEEDPHHVKRSAA